MDEMIHLYAAVDCSDTVGTFSTLEKAKAAVEAKIIADMRKGIYGKRYMPQDSMPELTWQFQEEGGVHKCGFVRPTFGRRYPDHVLAWSYCDPIIYTIELDPKEL
jgi:hypothetical protein